MVSLSIGIARLLAFPLLPALCALVLPATAPATVFLYRVTDKEILVGADSFFEVDGIEQPPNAVKIHQAGSFFYAFQGKSRIGKTKLIDLVEKAKSAPGERIDIAAFAPIFQQALTRWLKETSQVRPDLHRPYATNGIVMTSFQLFGFRQGQPFMETLEFVTEHSGTSVAIRVQNMEFAKGKPTWIPAGTWTRNHSAVEFFTISDPVAHLRSLFDREIRAAPPSGQPKLSRPPLDILRVSGTGAQWIQRKPECPEIRPYRHAESVSLSSNR